jgi:hypothetical protein
MNTKSHKANIMKTLILILTLTATFAQAQTTTRCVFEIDVFREMHPLAQKLLMPWFNATAPKMIPYMELHHAKN